MVGDGGSELVYMQYAAPNSLVASVKEIAPLLKAHSPTLYAHLLSTLNQSDPLSFSQALL